MLRHLVFRSAFLFVGALSLASCAKLTGPGEATQIDHVDTTAVDSEKKLWWTGRVAGALANGKAQLTDAELQDLSTKSDDEVIDTLMARPEFKETLIAFSLDYLGFRSDKLKYPDASLFSHQTSLAQFPSALAAADAVAADGDFFEVLNFRQPMFALPLSSDALVTEGIYKGLSGAEARKVAFQQNRQLLKSLLADFEKKPDTPYYEVCNQFFNKVDFNTFVNLGMSFDFFSGNLAGFIGPVGQICNSFVEGREVDTKAMILGSIKHWDELETYLQTELDPSVYKVTGRASLKPYDLVKLGFATEETRADEEAKFGAMWFWKAMVNSSTNFNRKRASYVLKRFFCDDLTPIAVETPMTHAEGKHATDPSCQACHYKLDPMAGFFRYNGMSGENFKKQEMLTFDDGAQVEMAAYLKSWNKADGSLDVGYIRSVNDETLNDRSANKKDPEMADLFTIVKTAPEARQCLVKTMMKFLVGENIALDAGYLESLSSSFSQEVDTVGSGKALKDTIKKILVSKTFTETNPVEDVCYDYAPGVDPTGLPPCKVARILEKNCQTCHNATSSQGGLNLQSWKPQVDGVMGFDNEGAAAKDTFQLISDRLSASDEALRMPLKQHMATVEREELYLWITTQLAAKEVTP